jgi:tyrosyl-tRNA synthetase
MKKTLVDQEKIKQFFSWGLEEVIRKDELEKMLTTGNQLTFYLGVDPTSPVIHLGHAVVLRKLRELQDLGHRIILLIGDFTGRIGDPTGKDIMRKQLTHQDVLNNAASYRDQAAKILDFEDNKAEIKYNSEWLDKLTFKEVIELSAQFTVQQMLERDMFQKRISGALPIGLHEFLYPLMQGYDSVAMDVDGEIGGSDQLFNMLAGRTLMEKLKGKTKIVMTAQLLEGTDGRKMSKSYGNVIGVSDEPNDMFGKVMSIGDELIVRYFELCTNLTTLEIVKVKKELASGGNPREVKVQLAKAIVAKYHSAGEADKAEAEFNKMFRDKERPTDIPQIEVDKKDWLIADLLIKLDLATSKAEATRLVEQGGVKVNDIVISDWRQIIVVKPTDVIQVGKRKFIQIK